jgi:phage-related protein
MKQDLNGVRTAQDLERKYDLASLVGIKKAVRQSEEGIVKTNQELENFMQVTTRNIELLKSEIDGNITTYFYSGVPTLSTLPASEWETIEYDNHLGDLYYDQDTGAAYRFVKQDDDYLWLLVPDTAVAEALAVAQKAQDTADGKRRVFTTTPFVPYDEGDLWLRSDELYVCHTSNTIAFNIDDFRKATKYTDDTALNTFISSTYSENLKAVNNQIDKKAETWYQSTDPSTQWITIDLKEAHIGDLWYNTTNKKNYVFTSSYTWEEIDGVPDDVYDEIDSKAQIFTTQPIAPYYVGDLYVQGNNGDIYVCIVERLSGNYTASEWEKASKYTDDTALKTFISGDYADDIKTIEGQIDKKAETWYQNNDPSTNWTTEEVKKAHVGDLWYKIDENKNYIYTDTYTWQEVDGVPDNVYDAIDGKAQIFTSTPTTPYYVGDLFTQGSTGDILVCKTERLTGSYNVSDWQKASKYTDDGALNNFINGTYSDDIEEINSQIDKKAETWYQASDPSSTWTTTALKNSHVGDLWFNTSTNKSYIYTSSYTWKEADGVPDSVYDEIDGKAQIFASQPTPPYHVGDLYVQGSNGDIYVCKTERLTGSYTSSDWSKASKYTDDTELHNFVNVTFTESMQNLTNQIDSKVTTWYYSGVPTLNNAPASSWSTDDRLKHTGDLYYDKSSGKSYIFQLENSIYKWVLVEDRDISEALALANASQDTADSKRRVFVSTPYPPYDNGDLWFNNKEIYICQISKATGSFATNDFIIATKYTDDTLATQVGDNLEVVRGQVLNVTQGVDAFKIDIETQIKTINDLQEENIEAIERMSYTFGTNDLAIAKSSDPVNARINNQGLKVYTYNSLSSIFNHRGTGVQKLIVVGDTQLANISIVKATDENGDACTDINHLVSNIQNLSDLEV